VRYGRDKTLPRDRRGDSGNSPVKQHWLNEHKQILFEGQALHLAQTLQALAAGQTGGVRDNLLEQAGYFENNQHGMNYLELREEGWLIGSGMVESGAKQFKDRFTGPGMRLPRRRPWMT
jgi:hypothetical protein